MSTAILERRDVAKRTYASVRIDGDVLEDCRVAASLSGQPISDFISDILRPIVKEKIKAMYEAKYGKKPKDK